MSILEEIGADLEHLPNILLKMEDDLSDAAKHLKMKGRSLDELLIEQASWVGHYQTRHIELKTIRRHLESRIERQRGKLWKHYTEKVQRELQYRDKEHYVNCEDSVSSLKTVFHTVQEMEEKYEAMVDALRQKGFALNNVVKLKVAAIDGAVLL